MSSSFFEQNTLTQYITPPNNYIGSTIFLSYILVALYLTSTIGYRLYTQYAAVFNLHPSSPPSRFKQNGQGKVETRSARKRHVKIYTALALISFTSISWHMLGFLITSFLDWSDSGTRNVFAVLGSNASNQLKRWMLETSLFSDFAVQLVADGESAVWTQFAILATWGWNLVLASKGRQYNFTSSLMVPFIILGQNLPISFTAALFIVQLHLSAPDVNPNAGKDEKDKTQHVQPKQIPVASLMLPTVILNAILLAQPSLRGHPGFSYLLLVERLLLVLPHTGLLKITSADMQRSAAISGGFVVANWAMMRKAINIRDVLAALVWQGQAVKTMAWDAVLSAVVYGVLSWGGGV
ncbi:hypothetical protein E8E12_007677 [Didymella heteroderae]|uniref:Uncharacterized protein n=1 Tax=Didymella heteroderae TaxID=1769908 RepID=A0A9P4WUZ1_9PLEO|nr:hypothetical protein E8E12_007677 [Didymella heteroderae]